MDPEHDSSNLTRRQRRAALDIQRLAHSLFRSLDLNVGYDKVSITFGGGDAPGEPWSVTVDENDLDHLMLHVTAPSLPEALSRVVAGVSRAQLSARGDV